VLYSGTALGVYVAKFVFKFICIGDKKWWNFLFGYCKVYETLLKGGKYEKHKL
jgi:hypothetical protein